MSRPAFDEYLASLSSVSPEAVAVDPAALEYCEEVTEVLQAMEPIDAPRLAKAVRSDPDIARVLATAVGLSQERFRTWLNSTFNTSGWVTLGRERGPELVQAMDRDFGLLSLLGEQAHREWTWADMLARSMAPRRSAGSAIKQGRNLEDAVESVIAKVGLQFVPRTRFEGRAGGSAPSDFAIPAGGQDAAIAIAVKGFDSTGSKLTDARREIEEMAKIRRPRQYIFAVVDGHGWLRRKNDLKQIHQLWMTQEIDGLYTRNTLGSFQSALADAARRSNLLND